MLLYGVNGEPTEHLSYSQVRKLIMAAEWPITMSFGMPGLGGQRSSDTPQSPVPPLGADELFDKLDRNHDGVIDKHEFTQAAKENLFTPAAFALPASSPSPSPPASSNSQEESPGATLQAFTHCFGAVSEPPGRAAEEQMVQLQQQLARRAVTDGQLFAAADENRDNKLNMAEFEKGLSMMGVRPMPGPAELQSLFEMYDTDRDGWIQWKELQDANRLRDAAPLRNRQQPSSSDPLVGEEPSQEPGREPQEGSPEISIPATMGSPAESVLLVPSPSPRPPPMQMLSELSEERSSSVSPNQGHKPAVSSWRMLNLSALDEASETTETCDTPTSILGTPRVPTTPGTPKSRDELLLRLKEAQKELADAQGKFLSLKRKLKQARAEAAKSRAATQQLQVQNEQLVKEHAARDEAEAGSPFGGDDRSMQGRDVSQELADALAGQQIATTQLAEAKLRHARELDLREQDLQQALDELDVVKRQLIVSQRRQHVAEEDSRELREQVALCNQKSAQDARAIQQLTSKLSQLQATVRSLSPERSSIERVAEQHNRAQSTLGTWAATSDVKLLPRTPHAGLQKTEHHLASEKKLSASQRRLAEAQKRLETMKKHAASKRG